MSNPAPVPKAVPLYLQIADWLRDGLESGKWLPGQTLPSEAELQHKFDVSRSVVRQALSLLVEEERIVRSRGRGSVVREAPRHHRLVQRLSGLSSQLESTGQKVSTQILRISQVEQPPNQIQLFEPQLVKLERLRSVAKTPLALIHTWLPHSLAAGLDAQNLTDNSLHRLLLDLHNTQITIGQREVSASAANREQSRLLDVPEGSPLLVLSGYSFNQHQQKVEFFRTWHRADLMVFDLHIVDNASSIPEAAEVSVDQPKATTTELHREREQLKALADQLLTTAEQLHRQLSS